MTRGRCVWCGRGWKVGEAELSSTQTEGRAPRGKPIRHCAAKQTRPTSEPEIDQRTNRGPPSFSRLAPLRPRPSEIPTGTLPDPQQQPTPTRQFMHPTGSAGRTDRMLTGDLAL